jgi:hypothetical protein
MGWWNSIIDGVSNAAGWVIDNAGTIGTVVSTVAKVAAFAIAAEEEDVGDLGILTADEPFDMPKFINTMDKAEQVLSAASASAAKEELKKRLKLRAATGSPFNGLTLHDTFSGLWPEPVVDHNNNPGQCMTADLSHMLAMLQFPQTVKVGKIEEDVAQKLGMSIFAEPPNSAAADATDLPYHVATTSVQADDGSDVVCSHAYYTIPSGGEGHEKSWHSAISLSIAVPVNSRKAYQEARLKAAQVPPAITLDQINAADIGNIWQVTLNVLWTAATYAVKAAPLLVSYIMQSGAVLEIKYIQTDGLTTFIQIKAGQNVTPFQAREAVLSAANQAVIDVEAQNSARAVTAKEGATLKPTSSGLTQVTILANKLMPYAVSKPAKPEACGEPDANGHGYGNGTADSVKKTTQNQIQRRLVSFQPLLEGFGDGLDFGEYDHDGAQFYVPLFPVTSRMKSAQA